VREGEGRGGERRSTYLPPRFDNRGYRPVRGGKGRGKRGRDGKGVGGEREGGRRKRRKGERDLAPQKKKSWRRHWCIASCELLTVRSEVVYVNIYSIRCQLRAGRS